MRNYLSEQPENFGQFLGRTLSGTVAPYLQQQQETKRLSLADAEDRALKMRNLLGDEQYRNAMLGETNRHNLAMEQPKPEKTRELNSFEEAAIATYYDQSLSPQEKARRIADLHARHTEFHPSKEPKAPIDPNEPSSYPQVKGNAIDFRQAALDRFEPRLRQGLAGLKEQGTFDPYTYNQQSGLAGMKMSDLIAAGQTKRNLLGSESQAALDSAVTAQGTPPMDLARKWGYLGGDGATVTPSMMSTRGLPVQNQNGSPAPTQSTSDQDIIAQLAQEYGDEWNAADDRTRNAAIARRKRELGIQ